MKCIIPLTSIDNFVLLLPGLEACPSISVARVGLGSVVLSIDFSIDGPCTENCPISQRTPNILIDLVIKIELTRAIFLPRFSNFLRNSTIDFRMFLYLITCFMRVKVSLLCRLQTVSKIQVPIYSNL